jgi:hypothetical protein
MEMKKSSAGEGQGFSKFAPQFEDFMPGDPSKSNWPEYGTPKDRQPVKKSCIDRLDRQGWFTVFETKDSRKAGQQYQALIRMYGAANVKLRHVFLDEEALQQEERARRIVRWQEIIFKR